MPQTDNTHIVKKFDRAAKDYDNYAVVQRHATDHLFTLAKPYLTEISFWLDCGCGTGYFQEVLRRNKRYLPLVQLDLAYNMCIRAQTYAAPKEYGGTYTVNADLHHPPFVPQQFDGVFSAMTLHWFDDLTTTFLSLKPLIKKNGHFAFAIMSHGSLRELDISAKHLHVPNLINPFPKKSSIEESLEQCGFTHYQLQEQVITTNHEHATDVLKMIKMIGASTKLTPSNEFIGREFFVALDQYYLDNFAEDNLLPATWKIIHITGQV